MRIDVHSHFMSQHIATALEKRSHFPYTRLVDGTWHFHCCQNLVVPMMPALYDIPTKIAHIDEAGIDVSILSLAIPGPDRVGGALADDLALKSLYMDTVAYEPEPLEWCLSMMGAEHLLLGTDYPYSNWRKPLELVDAVDCTDVERQLMLYGNAERLFRKVG